MKRTLIAVICVLSLILVIQNVQKYMRPSPRGFNPAMMDSRNDSDRSSSRGGMMFPGMMGGGQRGLR